MKINIIRPTGNETFNLLTAFKVENNIYVVFDIERTSPMGLPAVYVSKYTTKLEKISDPNEWESVKGYLKGIISGTNFLYVTIPDTVNADEAYFVQLYLPSQAAFDLIKTRYVPSQESVLKPSKDTTLDTTTTTVIPNEEVRKEEVIDTPVIPITNEVAPNIAPDAPIIPEAPKEVEAPVINNPVVENTPVDIPVDVSTPLNPTNTNNVNLDFDTDKETFLKACENMFDALISKYQKNIAELEAREQAINLKEKEIESKMAQAKEHLANAEAREQVANIAHDNAQKVMNTIPSDDTAVI